MNKQKADESNTTQGTGSKQTADTPKTKSGKDAESHTKAGTGKGAGGGAKQGRKH